METPLRGRRSATMRRPRSRATRLRVLVPRSTVDHGTTKAWIVRPSLGLPPSRTTWPARVSEERRPDRWPTETSRLESFRDSEPRDARAPATQAEELTRLPARL